MSLKSVTMIEGTDGLYSKALERAYSTQEETSLLESNRLPGCPSHAVRYSECNER